MSLKISELTASSGITADDLIPVVNDPSGSPQTLKATGQQFLDYVTGSTFNQLNVQSTTEQITLQALDNDINITAQYDIDIIAQDDIGIEASDNIDIIAGDTLDVQAENNIEIVSNTSDINISAPNSQIILSSSNPVTITSRLSGTTSEFVEVTASVVSASTYVGLPLFSGSGLPNGPDTSLQFRSGSDFAGSADLVYDYNLGILSGTYAEFTEITASIISASSYVGIPSPSVALEDLTDVVLTFPVSGQILKYNGSNWINSSDETGSGGSGVPGGTNTTIQFNSGSTFSGSTNLVYDYSSDTLSGTTAQFTTISASSVTIGDAEDGDYSDGLFTSFTKNTSIGLVVDRFNEVLKGLAPSPAANLSNIERSVSGGNSMKLSFGASSSTSSYTNVSASLSGLTNVDIGGTYSVINGAGGNPIRLGIFTSLTALTATLNNDAAANAGAFTNYPAKAFNVSADGIGSYEVEVNGTILVPTGSTTSVLSYNSGNVVLSLANTGSFVGSGQSFDLFRHRTGSVTIPTSSWRNGHNYAKITHVSSLGTHVSNYIDWIYDPQAASGNSAYSFTTTSSSFVITGLKELSGIKYYTACSYSFSSSIQNYYKNCYPTASNGGITFTNLTTGLTATAFASTPAPANSDEVLQRSSLHTLSGVRILGASISSSMSVNNTLGKTGVSTVTTPTILFDNVDTANTDTVENFCLENYRVISASYNTQASLTGASAYPSGSSLSSTELAVYSGSVIYPTRVLNSGNVSGSGVVYMLASQPNYSGSTEDRFYLRKFVNGASALATFNLILTGSNINFAAFGGSLSGNNVKISVKVPGKTGWRDVLTAAPANTTGIELNDDVGCLAGSAPSNITTSAGRSISINLLTEAIGANESYIVRILTSKDWTGTITKLQIS